MRLWAGTYVPVAFAPMMRSILGMIILPLAAGLLIHRTLPRWPRSWSACCRSWRCSRSAPSSAITIALSREDLLKVGFALLGASAVHNRSATCSATRAPGSRALDARDCRTVALEVGIQNGGHGDGARVQRAAQRPGGDGFGHLRAVERDHPLRARIVVAKAMTLRSGRSPR
jgi:BASS family bile acid:Na+ symporter